MTRCRSSQRPAAQYSAKTALRPDALEQGTPNPLIQNMNLETVAYDMQSGIASLTMNRADALNALSMQLIRDLAAAIRQAADDGARAVILTGTGRAFCAGGDLREMQAIGQSEGRIEAFLEGPLDALHDVIRLIRE